jgi:hypothetical protein
MTITLDFTISRLYYITFTTLTYNASSNLFSAHSYIDFLLISVALLYTLEALFWQDCTRQKTYGLGHLPFYSALMVEKLYFVLRLHVVSGKVGEGGGGS